MFRKIQFEDTDSEVFNEIRQQHYWSVNKLEPKIRGILQVRNKPHYLGVMMARSTCEQEELRYVTGLVTLCRDVYTRIPPILDLAQWTNLTRRRWLKAY